jgi:hypothetical protein
VPESQGSADASGDLAERVVLRAMSRDASLEEEVARAFVARALDWVAGGGDPHDAPELARRLLDADREAGASTATIVAASVSEVFADNSG